MLSKKQEKWLKKLHEMARGRTPWNKGLKTGMIPKTAFKKGIVPWNKGTKGIMKKNKTSFQRGIIPHNWKGDDAGYAAMHQWVKRYLGRPNRCEHCGSNDNKKYQWANKDHKYKRDLKDWIRLCAKCHQKYDIENNGYNLFGKHEKI